VLLLSLFLEKSSFVFDSSFLLLLSEVFVVEFAIEVEIFKVDPSRCGNHESLVDSSKGDTVDLIRSSDEQETARTDLFQEDGLSSLERTLKKDNDGARLERVSEMSRVNLKVTMKTSFRLFFAVKFGRLGLNDSDFVLVEDLNLGFFRQRNSTRLRLPFRGLSVEPLSPLGCAS